MSVYFGRECGDEDFKTLVITNYGSEKNQITKIEKIDNCFQIINIETTKPALQKQFNKDDLDNSNLKTKPNQNGNKHQKHNDLSEIDTEDPSLAVYNITEKAYLTIENSTLTFPVVFAAETITYSVESSTQSINLFCLIEAEYIYMYGRINSTNSPIEIYTNITSNPFEVYFENTKFLGSGYLPVTILVVFEFILIIIFLYLFYKISLIRTGITHLLKSFTQVTEKTPLNKTENDLPSFSSSSLPSSSPKNSELSNSNLSNTDNQISEEDSSLLD
ncbi:hypothetical protein M0813_02990 [Anaeramoeba flamelloides]|uniref:Uncharacterized protein n=1 Tax=Anaeramoeba flamelloides TaxID=1746091 RepID=A0ABQ8YF24_9EUKA|nr:hypothetical protein M0813_02990 [Anaeramoeba flamelloides]